MNLAVEGLADAVAGRKLLEQGGHAVGTVVVKRGKTELDPLVLRLNRAARHAPWLVLRDADRDGGDCPVRLRQELLPEGQDNGLCLRLPVRSLEAWLLADAEAFSGHFHVRAALVPVAPELEVSAKGALVRACRGSTSRAVRASMCRPDDKPGPGYTPGLTGFVRERWTPLRAAERSPSLARAITDVARRFDGLV